MKKNENDIDETDVFTAYESTEAADAGEKQLRAKTLGEVVVTISSDDFVNMQFLFAKQLSREKHANRQEWLGLTTDEMVTKKHEVAVRDFAQLIREEPLNVPNWKTGTKETLKDRFIHYFDNEENASFIEWLNVLYLGKLVPREYTS
ncbi:MAG TPA: hypothetical protein VNI84_21125 [Pyrinomonadaceae bacterium]|nr:hypothetical protein [Pyrinomonadaceae bacterium]